MSVHDGSEWASDSPKVTSGRMFVWLRHATGKDVRYDMMRVEGLRGVLG